MKVYYRLFVSLVLCVALTLPVLAAPLRSDAPAPPRFQVLVFSKTGGFRHDSIPVGIKAVQDMGREQNFEVTATEDASVFTDAGLSGYEAVIFLNTTGDILNASQETALQRYVENGGGWVGVHAAADTEYEWGWYGELVGGYFDSHPQNQTATIVVADQVFPATSHLPERWERLDEWYNYQVNPRGDVHVLMSLDEKTYEGGNMGFDHPIAWAHEVGEGRALYTGLGHTAESYADPMYLQHLQGAIEWAAGAVPGDAGATLASNFKTIVLEDQVTDPMELDIAADGRVFWVERQGPVRVWDPQTGETHLAGSLPSLMVIEDGASGMALDPDFMQNGWIYFYYTPVSGEPNRIARFTYRDGEIDLSTEKVLLEVPVQRHFCCHSAGYLYFDHEGYLWLSTGDNTHNIIRGGSPIDEIPGEEFSDAQRSSANTNDLRGKVLRIKPLPDGTYEIPEGNLFEPDAEHRGEIYTMGHRNPWRFTVDSETGWLYIGEVGLGNPPSDMGPWGWEEVNRAKEPGFFGWPYFAGASEPYADFNAATKVIGSMFDPNNVINDSPNNTGAQQLPPATPAFMWYTYGQSEDFPELGAGGMSAAAGPVYHRPATAGPYALPEYYDGSLFVYEWMRNWIVEVRMDDQGEILKINPFLPGTESIRPIDMKIGPDGALYVAEWGDEFWGSNPNARIVKLEYHGEPQMPMTADAAVEKPASVSFTWPPDGGFVAYGEPIHYAVDAASGGNVQVNVYTGHDTHAHLVEEMNGATGTATVAADANQHYPPLYLSDRYIKLEAQRGSETASVKLRPKRMDAEHTFDRTASRLSIGGHPAGEGYAETVIIALAANDGEYAAYSPVNLANIEALNLRVKPLERTTIDVRLDSPEGFLLGQVTVDSVAAAGTPIVPEQRLEYNEIYDQAMIAHGGSYVPKLDVYEGWYEVNVPVKDPGGTHKLYLVFHGEASGPLVQVDWVEFEGAGVNGGRVHSSH